MNLTDAQTALLTRLADKLGTTIDHLWSVLVRQAYIEAFTSLLTALAFSAGLVWIFRFVRRKTTKKEPADKWSIPRAEWDDDVGAAFAWFGVFALLCVVISIDYSAISTITTALFNPEYWALKQIIP